MNFAAWNKPPSSPPENEPSDSDRPTVPAPPSFPAPSLDASLEQLFEPMILRKRFARTVAK